MSRVMRNPAFCLCEKKVADQLHCNLAADQHLSFRYIDYLCSEKKGADQLRGYIIDSTIPLLPLSKISSLLRSFMTAQPSLCLTWLETLKTGFS